MPYKTESILNNDVNINAYHLLTSLTEYFFNYIDLDDFNNKYLKT